MRLRPRYLLIAPPLVFLGVFYFYPLASIFSLSFSPDMTGQGAGLTGLFKTGYYGRVLLFTLGQAAASTVLTLAAALPGAYVFARYDFPGKALIQSLTAIPFVLPTVVTAAAFKALLGRGGLVNGWLAPTLGLDGPLIDIDHTYWFFLLAHVFYNYTVVLRLVGGFWARLPQELSGAARVLGASGRAVFFRITLPLLKPAILAASLLVFIFCFTSFGVVLILGGPGLATLEVEIFRQTAYLFNLPLAAALSLVQIVFTFGLMAVYTRFERKSSVSMMPQTTPRRAAQPGVGGRGRLGSRLIIGATLAGLALLLGAPPLALIVASFSSSSGPTLAHYAALAQNPTQSILYVSPLTAMANSLGYALAAMSIALTLGWLVSSFLAGAGGKGGRSAWLDPVFMLPLSTSAVTLGFGFIVALDEPPLNLRTSWLLPALAHALVAAPFVIRALLPARRAIPPALREAAAVLGASPWRIWRTVDWPILGRAVAVAAVFAFAMSMGEFGASIFVARPQTPTLPLAIYRFLTHPGEMNYGQAMAMSCLLMLTTALGFVVLEKLRPRGDF